MRFDQRIVLQEKTRAAAAPRNPKKGAVSSPVKVDIARWICETLEFGSPNSCRAVDEEEEEGPTTGIGDNRFVGVNIITL